MKKLRNILTIVVIGVSMAATGQETKYVTKPYNTRIKTLRTNINGDLMQNLPLIALNGQQSIEFSFDELDAEIKNYSYTVVNCNADWTVSSLSTMEWGDGFATNELSDVSTSVNTTQQYVHYRLSLPNDDLKFKVSGNYALIIHDTEYTDSIAAVFCFCVSEQAIVVTGKVTADTRKEIKRRYQELNFDVLTSGLDVRDPATEIKVMVTQNNRPDLCRWLTPTYISAGKLTYSNSDELVFEGGTEYRTIDFSSRYSYGDGIERIKFYDPLYHVELQPNPVRTNVPYEYTRDVNGRYVINVQEWDDDELSSDYYMVHFFVPMEKPLFGGSLYVMGEFNQNRLNRYAKMIYNAQLGGYERSIFMKQGGYNYLYAYKPKGQKRATLDPVEGSHWETENEYQIYVYYSPFSGRGERLIGTATLNSK